MASFTKLPNELVLEITGFLTSFKDITALAAMSRNAEWLVGSTIMPSLQALDLGHNFLYWAVWNHRPRSLERALEFGIDPNVELLFGSAWHGHPEIIHLLIRHGAEVDKLAAIDAAISNVTRYTTCIKAEYTALQVAILRGQLETVKILSQAGASHRIFQVWRPLPQGVVVPQMSLHYASFIQEYELVKWLVESEYQTDVNALDESGMAPLAYWGIFGTQASIADY
ncbi:hypothetical protein PG984_005813 [Apiospora sp. TS-2023a]